MRWSSSEASSGAPVSSADEIAEGYRIFGEDKADKRADRIVKAATAQRPHQ